MKIGEGKYLITTDAWFYAPNGQQYKAVWGNVTIIQDDSLGIKTNRGSTNWYALVGKGDKQVVVAGCQIHYAVKCVDKPNGKRIDNETIHEGNLINLSIQSAIYLTE